MYAVYHNHPHIVEMLLTSGADMTLEMESGHTPLSLSMVLGHKQGEVMLGCVCVCVCVCVGGI